MPLVAEDLGIITDEVRALRDRFELPGMVVLQFAFDGSPDNPHLPRHHRRNAVVYTGTHDNDTTVGWYASLDAQARDVVHGMLGVGPDAAGARVSHRSRLRLERRARDRADAGPARRAIRARA